MRMQSSGTVNRGQLVLDEPLRVPAAAHSRLVNNPDQIVVPMQSHRSARTKRET